MVSAPGGRLHVRDFAGEDSALVVMHGFPDDSRIYDRVDPLLAPAGWWLWIGSAMAARTASSRLPFDGAWQPE